MALLKHRLCFPKGFFKIADDYKTNFDVSRLVKGLIASFNLPISHHY